MHNLTGGKFLDVEVQRFSEQRIPDPRVLMCTAASRGQIYVAHYGPRLIQLRLFALGFADLIISKNQTIMIYDSNKIMR